MLCLKSKLLTEISQQNNQPLDDDLLNFIKTMKQKKNTKGKRKKKKPKF